MGSITYLPTTEAYSFPNKLSLPAKQRPAPHLDALLEESGTTRKEKETDPSAVLPGSTISGGEEAATDPSLSADVLDTSALYEESAPSTDEAPPEQEEAQPAPETPIIDRATLRAHMLTHSLKGAKMSKIRTPFVGEITIVKSPDDPEVEFGLKRLGNREVMIHRDRNSAVRYIQREGADEFISEKDYPLGTMMLDTVSLGLASWNLVDANGAPVEITRDNVLAYLSPDELTFLYEQVHELNPILSGKEARKNS